MAASSGLVSRRWTACCTPLISHRAAVDARYAWSTALNPSTQAGRSTLRRPDARTSWSGRGPGGFGAPRPLTAPPAPRSDPACGEDRGGGLALDMRMRADIVIPVSITFPIRLLLPAPGSQLSTLLVLPLLAVSGRVIGTSARLLRTIFERRACERGSGRQAEPSETTRLSPAVMRRANLLTSHTGRHTRPATDVSEQPPA